MTDQPILSTSTSTFGQANWPATGKIWVRIAPGDGSNALGWAHRDWAGCPAKALRSQSDAAKAQWKTTEVGSSCLIPTGYHPRHGTRWQTWVRVR
jgi:hypothetical protein